MYAGTIFTKGSGNLVGVHQRIDRTARRHVGPLLSETAIFPSIKEISYFEGNNGPDGVKRKSPSIDEPWHYIDPTKHTDTTVFDMITDHIENLSLALRNNNHARASFEAAWLARAIVDGLTPAHHFPLADKIEELFGMPHHERLTVKQKNIIKGDGKRDTLSKNWEYWGGGGIFSTHASFEIGISSMMIGRKFPSKISDDDLTDIQLRGYSAVYKDILSDIVAMDVYELYRAQGWNWRVARIVQNELLPQIIRAVGLGWYAAAHKAGLTR